MIHSQRICPWCGSREYKTGFSFENRIRYQCCNCEHFYEGYYKIVIVILLVWFLFFMLCKHIIPWQYLSLYTLSPIYIWMIYYYEKMPYKRIAQPRKYKYYPEEFLGFADITWLSHREGGLRLPNLTIWNHYILGVCFIDDEGKPISQTGYIRVNKMLLKKTRKIYRITDNFLYDKKRMRRFAVFYKQKRVGTGNMIL